MAMGLFFETRDFGFSAETLENGLIQTPPITSLQSAEYSGHAA